MGPSYVLLHPVYVRWSLYIYSGICTIMGSSYVHRLLWGLTPVHKMAPIYIYSVIRTIMSPSYVHRLLWGLTPIAT